MEPKEPIPKLYRLTNPLQEGIHRKLHQLVGPGPATFFKDACWLMTESPPLESTTHLVSHLFREIESALRHVLEPLAKPERILENPDESAKHKTAILAILSYLNIPESDAISQAWLRLAERGAEYSLPARAHRKDLSEPRPVDQDFLSFWEDSQTILKIVLDKFEAHYASVFEILDNSLAIDKPNSETTKELRNNVPQNTVTWGYFFGKLSNIEWLIPLKDAGFFENPPEPKFDDEKKTPRQIPWPQSQYLTRMASIYPEQVLKVILGLPDTENLFIHSDFADAALAMPPKLAAEWSMKEVCWINKHESIGLLLPQKLGELLGHLSRGNEADAALNLARSLLSTIPSTDSEKYRLPTEPRGRFDTWNYEQILVKQVPSLVTAAGEKALGALCALLDTAIKFYIKGRDRDYSYLWRPAIEVSSQNQFEQPKELLVSSIRDATIQIIKKEPTSAPFIIDGLEQRRWSIFQRLALHILWVFPFGNERLIEERLTDHTRFDNLELWHEYSMLAQNQFGNLRSDAQNKILKWISDGPDHTRFTKNHEKRTGNPPTKDEVDLFVKNWQLRKLAPINASLPTEWKRRYAELTKELGELEHPEFHAYTTGVSVGFASPKTVEELRPLKVAEVVSYLKNWRPSGGILAPSAEGLSTVLSSLVCSEPNRFAIDAQLFEGLDATYVQAVLDGLCKGVKEKRTFPWEPVLKLCQWAVDQPRDTKQPLDTLDFNMGWAWTRKTIAELLSSGFEAGSCEISYALRRTTWNVLKPITDDPDPTSEDEKSNYDPPNMDPYTLSLNTIRCQAIHTVVNYALWVKRNFERIDESKQQSAQGLNAMPEAGDVLEYHLDMQHDPALAMRAIYGQQFPRLLFLDKEWITGKVSTIFPRDESLRDFRDVAWETFVVYTRPYNDVFDVLRQEYANAIGRLSDSASKWRLIASPQERLAEHLMELYWRGKLDVTDDILVHYFEKASDTLRRVTLAFIGRSLLNEKGEIRTEVLDRLRTLWEYRMQASQSHSTELAAFGWWFASAKFAPDWSLNQLLTVLQRAGQIDADYQTINQLQKLAPEFPEPVIECLSLIFTGQRDPLMFIAYSQNVHAILTSVISSENSSAHDKAEILINRLTAAGHLEFKDLINKNLS